MSSPSINKDLHDLFNSDAIKRKFFHFRIFAIFCKKNGHMEFLPPSPPSPPRPLPRADSAGSELSTKCATNCTRAVAA